MKNFKTFEQFISEGKVVDKIKQQEEDMDAKELADILIITDVDENTLNEKDYSTEQRKAMAEKGLALPDGSFPIANIQDLKNAILSYGRSKDHSKVAKFIAKRAKALGAEDLIPDTEDFQKALKEVAMRVPARTIAIDDEDSEEN